MNNGDDVTIPIYIFQNDNLVIVGEALINMVGGRYYAAFDFDTPIDMGDQIAIPLNLVIGEKGERTPVGVFEFRRNHNGTEYTGSIEFADNPYLHQVMDGARSLINV